MTTTAVVMSTARDTSLGHEQLSLCDPGYDGIIFGIRRTRQQLLGYSGVNRSRERRLVAFLE
jgi:hypothetical protein